MSLYKNNSFRDAKDYVMIVVGLLCFAFGFTGFILPEKVVTGGVIGLASLLFFAFDWNVALTNYGINIALLIIAYHIVGRQFVLRTIFGATVASFIIGVIQPLFPEPIVQQQPFMNIIIGSILCGIGLGITFTHNGSSGGTDVIAAMATKRSNVSFGRMMLYCDVVIISSSWFIFKSPDKIVYGFVYLIINAIVADMVINSTRQGMQLMIFSEKWEELADAINERIQRGCTVLSGMGWYTKRDVKILLVMCRRHESVSIMRLVKLIDPDAFFTRSNVGAVYGKGFDQMRVKKAKDNEPLTVAVHTPEEIKESKEKE